MKLRILAFIAIVAMSVSGPANAAVSSEVKPGWLICNPINSALAEALTVKWDRETDGKGKPRNRISFHGVIHSNTSEMFLYEGEGIWESYCKKNGEDNWQKNYCSNAREVSFFNGKTLVKSMNEFRCRNEKLIDQE